MGAWSGLGHGIAEVVWTGVRQSPLFPPPHLKTRMSLLTRSFLGFATASAVHWPICVAPATFSLFSRADPSLSSGHHRLDHRRFLLQVTPPLRASFHSRRSSPSTYTMDANGDAGVKRKRSTIAGAAERPTKHLKPEGSVLTPGDSTPANGTVYDVEEDDDAGRMVAVGPAQADSPEWQAMIETVVKSVVSIHFCQTCSFDTDLSMSSQATGFVVDAERGYILTNRHVVCAGPFWGYVIFDNHEEVSFVCTG